MLHWLRSEAIRDCFTLQTLGAPVSGLAVEWASPAFSHRSGTSLWRVARICLYLLLCSLEEKVSAG